MSSHEFCNDLFAAHLLAKLLDVLNVGLLFKQDQGLWDICAEVCLPDYQSLVRLANGDTGDRGDHGRCLLLHIGLHKLVGHAVLEVVKGHQTLLSDLTVHRFQNAIVAHCCRWHALFHCALGDCGEEFPGECEISQQFPGCVNGQRENARCFCVDRLHKFKVFLR